MRVSRSPPPVPDRFGARSCASPRDRALVRLPLHPSSPLSRSTLHARRSTATRSRRAEVSAQDRCIGIDTAVAQEGPVAPRLLDQSRIALGDEHGRLRTCLGKDTAERITNEGMAEELQAIRARLRLEANTIRRCDEDTIRDRV